MKARYLVIHTTLFLVALPFQNCSKVAVADLPSQKSEPQVDANGTPNDNSDPNNSSSPPPLTGAPSTPHPTSSSPPVVTVVDLNTMCDEAAKTGKMSVTKTKVIFENPAAGCAWSEKGNLSMKDGYVRARTEQTQIAELPKNVKICQISMATQSQTMLYDDNMILTLNGYILASTTNFSRHFEKTNGYYKYSWQNLIDKPAQNGASDSTPDKQYCAGKEDGLAECLFPVTQVTAPIQLSFNERVIQQIMAATNPSMVQFDLITTGDNDPATDCHHLAIEMNLDIHHVP